MCTGVSAAPCTGGRACPGVCVTLCVAGAWGDDPLSSAAQMAPAQDGGVGCSKQVTWLTSCDESLYTACCVPGTRAVQELLMEDRNE